MLLKETLRKILKSQNKELQGDTGIKRNLIKKIKLNIPHAIIISGIRRCGKSTLMKQLMKNVKNLYYFNFEDPRALNFQLSDFERLNDVFNEELGDSEYYFFDEIQNVEGWERFVRNQQDLGKKFIITGSNASLLSKELGTKLTGRHLTYELFPFSYDEMLKLTSQNHSYSTLIDYSNRGGFPEFLKYNKTDMLQVLLRDIINRDIIARYNLRESRIIEELAVYLLSNVGKEFSYTKLAKYFKLGSTNTIISYISYLEDSYILFTIPKFNYSYKKQIISPKKVYSIDVGLAHVSTVSFSEDRGRVIENLVFLHLRRSHDDIYYYQDKGECDFLVKEKGKITQAIQVCTDLNEDNMERELHGLHEAMKKLRIKKGLIITLNQTDIVDRIEVVPIWDWIFTKP